MDDGILSEVCDVATWESVLTAQNSTPCIPDVIMRLMALPPPPPTPMTLRFALPSVGNCPLEALYAATGDERWQRGADRTDAPLVAAWCTGAETGATYCDRCELRGTWRMEEWLGQCAALWACARPLASLGERRSILHRCRDKFKSLLFKLLEPP